MFDSETFIKDSITQLKDKIKGKAIMGVSGGVDSTTAAILVNQAIGDNLFCVLVDTGFLRKGEVEKNHQMFKKIGLNVLSVDAKERFYKKLEKIIDPEEKRKIIGELFIRVFEEIAKEKKAKYFIQGTIAPDWIESGGGLRDTIKSHHNVGGLPKDINFEIVEPLRDIYKDEVRQVGKTLGLPEEIHQKQPFPGPGLAVRILGEATVRRAEVVREACHIVETEIEEAVKKKELEKPWQYFAVLLPLKAVGVHGDLRAYKNIVVVRAVTSIDGMSASYSKIPDTVLERISIQITNKLKNHVARVLYDITNKPPGTIEYE
ncbi:GMP synthase [Candidatus Roizmanbacteria bacterium RIFCSPHIGHO2_02_FULL_37_13b]|uniref:GMP synthase (glutamine-hydrolyzing) n=1 Tax=Candidatus Roizmanbacteria bacterium RIFCSPLOWO2_02_FULL_36_11 TaxID=1802071 RepID=A0A1F7JBM3_9BACT|nr:MAG: GMP synthase [Candidatus Roizmanbacteria bacterium RIFCSPHIGHO2_02_FULL_37_13b]OGK53006.1 MAG: GMP synthase [Candidatus Roizmanbacteria bacterium RIFCSPLOWO2_02_FULL_36_11]